MEKERWIRKLKARQVGSPALDGSKALGPGCSDHQESSRMLRSRVPLAGRHLSVTEEKERWIRKLKTEGKKQPRYWFLGARYLKRGRRS